MKIILYLSEFTIPLIVFYVVVYGLFSKRKVYEDFAEGAKDGIKTVVSILPTLIGLMVGVKVISASGLLEAAAKILGGLLGGFIPGEVIPVILVRLFSSSAATGLCLEIFEKYGADSVSGFMVSLFLSCTETVFYTMSVYYSAAKISKTRWTLPGALFACLAGTIASVVITMIVK